MKYVVFYDSADDVLQTAPAHFPAHKAWLDQFVERGELVMVGPFSDPVAHGSMAVFTTQEAAVAFVAGDPFIHNGVVTGSRIWEWREISA